MDTQYCSLKFGSWTFDSSGMIIIYFLFKIRLNSRYLFNTGINLTAESNKGQLDAYIKSAEWDLEG